MRLYRSHLSGVCDDAQSCCGWSCTGPLAALDPCCLLMIPGDIVVAGLQVGAAVTDPPPKSYPAPGAPLGVGPPANYDPSTGTCDPYCGAPTFPTQAQQATQTLSTITGTSCDPNSSALCRWFALGCQAKNQPGCSPAVPVWIPIGVVTIIALMFMRHR